MDGVKIHSGTVAAIRLIGGIAYRKKNNSALGIHGDRRPEAWTGAILPGIVRPGIVIWFARLRHGVKSPHFFSSMQIEGAWIAGKAVAPCFAKLGAKNQKIFINRGWRSDGIAGARNFIVKPGTQVNNSIVAKTRWQAAPSWHPPQLICLLT